MYCNPFSSCSIYFPRRALSKLLVITISAGWCVVQPAAPPSLATLCSRHLASSFFPDIPSCVFQYWAFLVTHSDPVLHPAFRGIFLKHVWWWEGKESNPVYFPVNQEKLSKFGHLTLTERKVTFHKKKKHKKNHLTLFRTLPWDSQETDIPDTPCHSNVLWRTFCGI